MKKRCLSIFLVLCMVMTLLPTTVWAADSDFTIDENGVLTKYNGPGGDVVIPDSVTSIGYEAFSECEELADVYYAGSKESWALIGGGGKPSGPNVTIHYNSAGPDDIGSDNMNPVYFLSGWDSATRTVKFGDPALISPDTYTVADGVDVSGISSLLNKYVLVAMEQGSSSLEYTITSIQPVESKIGTVSATGEHSLTIDGTTYPVREDWPGTVSVGEDVFYHINSGVIMSYSKINVSHGEIQAWNDIKGTLTIDDTEYATNFLTDRSFVTDIDIRLNNQYYFTTATTDNYTVLLAIGSAYYPGGKLEDFNADIYHAKWLSKHGSAADMLENDTPSKILIEAVNGKGGNLAIDMWRSLELIFDTLDDVTTLHDFAVGPKDVYSALILNALEASVSYDIVVSEYEDSLRKYLGNAFPHSVLL